MEKFLWVPSGKRKKESLLEDFSKYINIKSNYNFKTIGVRQALTARGRPCAKKLFID